MKAPAETIAIGDSPYVVLGPIPYWGAGNPFNPQNQSYSEPEGRRNGGNNYVFCEGHAKWFRLDATQAYGPGDPYYLWKTHKLRSAPFVAQNEKRRCQMSRWVRCMVLTIFACLAIGATVVGCKAKPADDPEASAVPQDVKAKMMGLGRAVEDRAGQKTQ